LVDPQQPYQSPADSLAGSETYKLFTEGYNTANAPIRLRNGGLIIMHKASMENTAPIQLTAVFADGRVIWRTNTGYAGISLLYKKTQVNKLFLMGTPAGKFNYPMQQMLCIDLANGSSYTYPIK
jgi:hypothetical protein